MERASGLHVVQVDCERCKRNQDRTLRMQIWNQLSLQNDLANETTVEQQAWTKIVGSRLDLRVFRKYVRARSVEVGL